MNHPEREEWVPYLFGEAGAQARKKLNAHLETCAECRQQVEAWRASLGRLEAWKLPRAEREPAFLQPVLRWAVAAALVLALGFGTGRLTSPASASPAALRAQVDAAVKAALTADLRQGLAADFQNALGQAQIQSSNALAALELRMALAADTEGQRLVAAVTEALSRAREEDRQEVVALFRDLERQHTAAYVALRKDLETVASFTDDEMRQARSKLFQLAAATQPAGAN